MGVVFVAFCRSVSIVQSGVVQFRIPCQPKVQRKQVYRPLACQSVDLYAPPFKLGRSTSFRIHQGACWLLCTVQVLQQPSCQPWLAFVCLSSGGMKLVGVAVCCIVIAASSADFRAVSNGNAIEIDHSQQELVELPRKLDGVSAPVFTSVSKAFTVAENAAVGTVVYTATSTGDVSRTYALTGGSRPDVVSLFAIHPTSGDVTVTGNINYESGELKDLTSGSTACCYVSLDLLCV
jgi:hypothetical protein